MTGRLCQKSGKIWRLKLAAGKGLSEGLPQEKIFWWNVRDLLNVVLN